MVTLHKIVLITGHFFVDVTKLVSDPWWPMLAGVDNFSADCARTIQGSRALCIDESMQAHPALYQPRSISRAAQKLRTFPSHLYREDAEAALDEIHERRGRRYSRSSVARKIQEGYPGKGA
jgi:hypothetical protein